MTFQYKEMTIFSSAKFQGAVKKPREAGES